MAGKLRPSLRAKTLHNVMNRSNLSESDKKCIQDVFRLYENFRNYTATHDVRTVTRCHKCTCWRELENSFSGYCRVHDSLTLDHDYCSYGIDKERNNDR